MATSAPQLPPAMRRAVYGRSHRRDTRARCQSRDRRGGRVGSAISVAHPRRRTMPPRARHRGIYDHLRRRRAVAERGNPGMRDVEIVSGTIISIAPAGCREHCAHQVRLRPIIGDAVGWIESNLQGNRAIPDPLPESSVGAHGRCLRAAASQLNVPLMREDGLRTRWTILWVRWGTSTYLRTYYL